MFLVVFRSYCGMEQELGTYDNLTDARMRIRIRNNYARDKGCPIVRLDRKTWEHQEPENCLMVPDFCGVLSIKKVK